MSTTEQDKYNVRTREVGSFPTAIFNSDIQLYVFTPVRVL